MATNEPYPYSGPPELREAIDAALSRVIDPEMALGIVDLGLVYGVEARPRQVTVRLTMTSAACPVAELIIDDAVRELTSALPEDVEVDVEMVWDPPWTPERMSPAARAAMGWD